MYTQLLYKEFLLSKINSLLLAVAGSLLAIFLGGCFWGLKLTLTFYIYLEIVAVYLLLAKLYLAEYDKKHFYMLLVSGFPESYLKGHICVYTGGLSVLGTVFAFLGLSVLVDCHILAFAKCFAFVIVGLLADIVVNSFLYNHLNYFLAKSITLGSSIAFSVVFVKILFLI